MRNFEKAIKAWSAILTSNRVVTHEGILKSMSTATFKTVQQISAVLKPINTHEIASIMKIASKNEIPVYPISGGKNWGLGSAVPQKDGVIIDLSLMKKISQFSEEMAHITVEPGVTFSAVEEFLAGKKSGLMLDSIGSTPQASIVGNTVERGHGMGLYADRFNFICGLEVVLPNGEIIETGFESMKQSKLGKLAKWGVGPYVDGLFTQSNLGIITKLTLWLKPKSNYFQSFIFHVNENKNLSEVMDIWRQVGLEGLQASLRIFNDIRMISFRQRFPEKENSPLSESARSMLRDKMKIGKWIGLGGLYAPSQMHADADREFIAERIGKYVDKLEFYDQSKVDQLYALGDESVKNELDFMFNRSLLRGYTSSAGINMVYWRKPVDTSIQDIHKDRCGVVWYCPAIPFTGKDSLNAIKISESICKKYGFELNLGFLFISQRTLDITGAICYDREVKGEDKRAMQCHDEIMNTMIEAGYTPYRLGIQSMKFLKFKNFGSRAFLKSLKRAIDPQNILAPGHYVD